MSLSKAMRHHRPAWPPLFLIGQPLVFHHSMIGIRELPVAVSADRGFSAYINSDGADGWRWWACCRWLYRKDSDFFLCSV